jgi:5'-nucleotidase/UDP-sugar diphosphatase
LLRTNECFLNVGEALILKTILYAAATFAAAAFFIAESNSVHAALATITFLHTNGVHKISPKGECDGLAELVILLRSKRARADHSITTFGGDLISPSVISGPAKGAQMIELLNALGTDVAVPGNHEFDFGSEVAATRIADSNFPWLGTNILDKDGMQAAGTVVSHIMSIGDYEIRIFGLLAPETVILNSPGRDIKFSATLETAKAAVKEFQAAAVDIIVAPTHLEFSEDRALAREIKGISLILSGHDHDPITFYEGNVLIQKAGHDAHYLAAVDLAVDRVVRRGKTVVQVTPSWRVVSTAAIAPYPEIKAIVDRHNATLDEELNVPVGKTSV